ncbi:uncharacterized protein LOC124938549 [Impatiens glandulifera]|uniref:uncharacterized protein LOC124938549 n=1 Tax=Impatiens glandulifera TaxID=253017 RepID=UPI001FB111DB|nr:uncharacterized protein LOC124938549 [Impatiens glandulifera]
MQRLHRLRNRGSSMADLLSVPQMRKKTLSAWIAVQDTYFSAKDIFEAHKVVFTVSTSIASVATAWVGYTMRHYHESKVEERLDSIEKAMKNKYDIEHGEFKKLIAPANSSTASYVATAGTSLIIGYGLGWRGGKWYANRQARKEQMKVLGQMKPKKWQLNNFFPRTPILRPKSSLARKMDGNTKSSDASPPPAAAAAAQQ